MGFLKMIFRKKERTDAGHKPIYSRDASSTSLGSTPSTHDTKSSSKKGFHPPTDIEPPVNPNVQVAKNMVELYNSNDITLDAFASLFVCDQEKLFIFEDGLTLSARDVAPVQIQIRKSFPDFKFEYDSIEILGNNKVSIEGMRASGTHTGAPFTCHPGLPAIPATGIHCVNDEERVVMELDDNAKIKKHWVISLGDKTGIAGLYEQIGGSLASPP